MKRIVTSLALAVVAALCGGVPAALAQDTVLASEFCNVKINSRVGGGVRHCTGVILRKDMPAARTIVILQFSDGFRLDIEGPVLAAGPHATALAPDRITWANPGQATPSVDTGGARGRIRGRCSIARFRGPLARDGGVYCRIAGADIRVNIEFKAPRPTGEPE